MKMKTSLVACVLVMLGGLIGALISASQIEVGLYRKVEDPFSKITMAVYCVLFALGFMGLGLAVGLQGSHSTATPVKPADEGEPPVEEDSVDWRLLVATRDEGEPPGERGDDE